MPDNEDFIWVVAPVSPAIPSQEPNYRGIREVTESVIRQGVQLPAETLKANFQAFFRNMVSLVNEIPLDKLPYTVEEIEICAEISAEGKIQLVGGITAGAKGGITFKLKRIASEQKNSNEAT